MSAVRAGIAAKNRGRFVVGIPGVFGWSTAEIAAAEGATRAAVQRARSRALTKLRPSIVVAEPPPRASLS